MLPAETILTFLFFVLIVAICTITAYALTHHNITAIYGSGITGGSDDGNYSGNYNVDDNIDSDVDGSIADDASAYNGGIMDDADSDPTTLLTVYKSLSGVNLNLKPAQLLKKSQSQVISRTISNAKLHMLALDIHPTKLSIAAIKRDIGILTAISKHLRDKSGHEEELISINNITEELKDKLNTTTSERTLSSDRETMFLEVATSCADKPTGLATVIDDAKIRRLEMELTKERGESERLRMELIKEQNKRPNTLMNDIVQDTMRSSYTFCMQQNEDLRQKIQSLQRDISNLQSRTTVDPSEINRLKAQRDSLQTELSRVQSLADSNVMRLTQDVSSLEAKLRECNRNLDAVIDIAAGA